DVLMNPDRINSQHQNVIRVTFPFSCRYQASHVTQHGSMTLSLAKQYLFCVITISRELECDRTSDLETNMKSPIWPDPETSMKIPSGQHTPTQPGWLIIPGNLSTSEDLFPELQLPP
ncbi:hypothetical protein STEG23_032230, partial [Scotinomys teguina]